MATATNDITGDTISTKYNSTKYTSGFDLIDWSKKDDKKDKLDERSDKQNESTSVAND